MVEWTEIGYWYIVVAMVLFHVGVVQLLVRGNLLDFETHFRFYKGYHSDTTNLVIHLFCIWPILWTYLYLAQQLVSPSLGWYVSMALYALPYVCMDQRGKGVLGWTAATLVIVCAATANVVPASYMSTVVYVHIGAWLAQFWGHAVHEVSDRVSSSLLCIYAEQHTYTYTHTHDTHRGRPPRCSPTWLRRFSLLLSSCGLSCLCISDSWASLTRPCSSLPRRKTN
jgi:hypothetical protein